MYTVCNTLHFYSVHTCNFVHDKPSGSYNLKYSIKMVEEKLSKGKAELLDKTLTGK